MATQRFLCWHCSACGKSGEFEADLSADDSKGRVLYDHRMASPTCAQPAFQILAPGERPGIPLRQAGDDGERMHILGAPTYHVSSWSEGDVTQGDPVTQVHFILEVPSLNGHVLLRMKSRRAIDELIDLLTTYRDHVWPEQKSEGN
jgi:hypothetical protein